MKTKQFSFFLILFYLTTFTLVEALQKAIVIVPVADLVGSPLGSGKSKEKTKNLYESIPFSGHPDICTRLHQALFNEVVTIIKEKGSEVKVKIHNSYYITESNDAPQAEYWTLKQNIVPINKLLSRKIDISKFPNPITFDHIRLHKNSKKTVSSKVPFYDSVTKKTYSAGTQFVVSQDDSSLPYYRIYVFDHSKFRFRSIKVLKKDCVPLGNESHQEKVKIFISLLKTWSSLEKGFIPYVLGGWSWTENCLDTKFQKNFSSKHYFTRNEWKRAPMGFDCVGMIGRASMICGIPFFYKNTTTLKKKLTSIGKSDTIEEGDLIWYPGHVIVISDVQKNLVIESRGYSYGFGELHEVPLKEVIQNAQTFGELKNNFLSNKPFQLKRKDGTVCKTFSNYKILKFKSVWDQKP